MSLVAVCWCCNMRQEKNSCWSESGVCARCHGAELFVCVCVYLVFVVFVVFVTRALFAIRCRWVMMPITTHTTMARIKNRRSSMNRVDSEVFLVDGHTEPDGGNCPWMSWACLDVISRV